MKLAEILKNREISEQKVFEFFKPKADVEYRIVVLPWQSEPMNPVGKFFAKHSVLAGTSNYPNWSDTPITTDVKETSRVISDVYYEAERCFGYNFAREMKNSLYPKSRCCIPILDLSDYKIKFWEMSRMTFDMLSQDFGDGRVYSPLFRSAAPLLIRNEKIRNGPITGLKHVLLRKKIELGNISNKHFPTLKDLYSDKIITTGKLNHLLLDFIEDDFDEYERLLSEDY